jgi:hypothetical protein
VNTSLSDLARALRGPILLITLGVLAALDHFGRFDFGQTWPVLIIVYGVMKLIEIGTRRPAAPPPLAGGPL